MAPLAVYPDWNRYFTKERQHRLFQVTAERRLWATVAAKREKISVNQWLLNDIDRDIDRDLARIQDDRRINGYVYVAGPIGGDVVKIGQSKRPRKRLPNIQKELGRGLIGLFYMQATLHPRAIEQETHRLLQDHHMGLEYFQVKPEIAAKVVDLAADLYSRQYAGADSG